MSNLTDTPTNYLAANLRLIEAADATRVPDEAATIQRC